MFDNPRSPGDPGFRPEGLTRRLRDKVRAAGYGSQLYAYTLKGRAPPGLAAAPVDPWPGDPEVGNALFQGRFAFAGRELVIPNQTPWTVAPPSPAWAAELHGFAWLRHFNACAGTTARRHARELVRAWIGQAGGWEAVSWRPEVLARRLVSWLCHSGFLLEGADGAFREALLASLAEQSRHLSRSAAEAEDGLPRLGAAAGLTVCRLCLPSTRRGHQRGLKLLLRELARQLEDDGVHASRNPSAQLAALNDLVLVRDTLLATGLETPQELSQAIARMAPMLRFFRHGDGGLGVFNGGAEESSTPIDATLARAAIAGRPPPQAPTGGYQRLAAGRTLLLVDGGGPPSRRFSAAASAGSLSFELSVAKERLIVNCGAARDPGGEWARVARSTAAHSTLTLADTNSCEIGADGLIGRRPGEVACRRFEEGGNLWLELSHDGYVDAFGLVHERRLYLDASGADLRGEDAIRGSGSKGGAGLAFAVRFHLHPGVRASLVADRSAALLRLPSGAGWRLRVTGGALALEESVYLAAGEPRRAEQLVVSGRLRPTEARVKWALSRAEG